MTIRVDSQDDSAIFSVQVYLQGGGYYEFAIDRSGQFTIARKDQNGAIQAQVGQGNVKDILQIAITISANQLAFDVNQSPAGSRSEPTSIVVSKVQWLLHSSSVLTTAYLYNFNLE
jgi:VCBS repeat-containing protein